MMKKAAFIITICLLFVFPRSAFSTRKAGIIQKNAARDFSAWDISASYILWTDIYEIEDVRTDFYITPEADEHNHKIIYEDDIAIEYDNKTLSATQCTLFYIWKNDPASDITKRWKKAACFYCAIEHGSPLSQNVDKEQSMKDADRFFENMNEVMFHRSEDFINGNNWIPFHTGKWAMYYLGYLEDEKQWLIMAK